MILEKLPSALLIIVLNLFFLQEMKDRNRTCMEFIHDIVSEVHRLKAELATTTVDNLELLKQLADDRSKALSVASVTSSRRSEATEKANAELRKQLEKADTQAREHRSEKARMLQEIKDSKSHSWEIAEENARLRKQLEESVTRAKNAKEENSRLLAAMEGIKKE